MPTPNLTHIAQAVASRSQTIADAVLKYSLKVVADGECLTTKDEQDCETILQRSFVEQMFITDDDVVANALHVACHKQCDMFWTTSTVMMSFFSHVELDLIEEIYNQRLIDTLYPTVFDKMHQHAVAYDAFRSIEQTSERTELLSLLTKSPLSRFDLVNAIHTVLYTQDPLDRQVFNIYVKMWYVVLQNSQIRSFINDHYK